MLEKNSRPYLARTASPPRRASAVPGFGPRLPGVFISATVSCSSLERLISGEEAWFRDHRTQCQAPTGEDFDSVMKMNVLQRATHQAVRSKAHSSPALSRFLRPDCHRIAV